MSVLSGAGWAARNRRSSGRAAARTAPGVPESFHGEIVRGHHLHREHRLGSSFCGCSALIAAKAPLAFLASAFDGSASDECRQMPFVASGHARAPGTDKGGAQPLGSRNCSGAG